MKSKNNKKCETEKQADKTLSTAAGTTTIIGGDSD